MRYRVKPVIQAYTLAALRGGPRETAADSREREQLTREILRYARGESAGRAVLVAGAAGVGKTSLVYEAMQRAHDLLVGQGLRPLLVHLDAPSLLMPAARPSSPASAALDEAMRDVEIVLRRAAVALFQALEEATWRALLERARDGALPPGVSRTELVELASRLRAELAQAPTLQDLRDLWRRAGLLEGGGLFGRPEDAGHGLREVLALWSAVRAWHVASDTVVGEASHGSEEARSAERKSETRWNLREALNPVLGLMAGGLVGASVYAESGVLAALLGTLSAILTGAALDLTVRHFREEKQLLTYKVTLDTTPYALTRMLPALVTHLRETGLAPVFVLDQLDRVKDQRARLEALLGQLKSFVAEDAFFCFLSDRDYYELLQHPGRPADAPRTSFSDRVFVCYRPAELRAWLRGVLAPEGPLQSAAEQREHELLVTALLGRTRMQLGDLHRRLRALTDLEGHLELPEGGVGASPAWQAVAIYQAALEQALMAPRLAACVADDPHALQIALDALFWPMELWERGEPLVLDRASLREELVRRAPLGRVSEVPLEPWLPEPQLAALYDGLLALAEGLADPPRLVARHPELDGLPLAPLLLRDPADPRRLRWRVDAWGIPSS